MQDYDLAITPQVLHPDAGHQSQKGSNRTIGWEDIDFIGSFGTKSIAGCELGAVEYFQQNYKNAAIRLSRWHFHIDSTVVESSENRDEASILLVSWP